MKFWKQFNDWWWRLTAPIPWIRDPLTWVFHGLVGFAMGFALGGFGWGYATCFYGTKEYIESDRFRRIALDNVMDFTFPLIGGLIGTWVR